MLLSDTFRATGPPPPGLVPIAGGTIAVPEPTQTAIPPVKAPLSAPALEPASNPDHKSHKYVPTIPKAPPAPAGGASAFDAHIIASSDSEAAAPPPTLIISRAETTPPAPEPEVSLRHPPPAEPLSQRTRLQLSKEELEIVQQLSARDRVVRAHEQAHVAAASGLAGSPSFTYVTGPDAQRYAVSGEVKIDANSDPGSPEATIAKMEQVKKAALAPAQPSAQDKAVANAAEATIREAQSEIKARERDEAEQLAIEATSNNSSAIQNNEPIATAAVIQANAAFSQGASTLNPTPISRESLIA